MKHPTAPRSVVLTLQDLDRFRFGFARVDHYRQIAFTCRPKLSFEHLDLHVAWRVVVMEVETNLAPRDHVFVVDEIFDLFFGSVVVEARVVRMRADSGEN